MSAIGTTEFEERAIDEIIEDIVESVRSSMERANLTPSQYIYQVIKICATREYEMEQKLKAAASSVSIVEAGGQTLDRWGVECGIARKLAVKSTGEIRITGTPNDDTVAIGSQFQTNTGLYFISTESGYLPSIMEMTRDTDQTDAIPTPYSAISSVDWINTIRDRSGTEYTETTDWTYADDVITWVAGKGPAAGATYYIGISGSISVDASIIAVNAGIDGNVPENSVVINKSGKNVTITNPAETSGGLDEEEDHTYRVRLLMARRRTFTLERIRDILAQIDGVRSVKVAQDTGADQVSCGETDSVPDWTTYGQSGGAITDIEDKDAAIQVFYPDENIVSLRAVTVTGQRVGTPPDLRCDMVYWSSGLQYTGGETILSTGIFGSDDTNPDSPTTWQDLVIPMYYGGFDYSRTYGLVFTQSEATAANHWELMRHESGYGANWRSQLLYYSGAVTTPYEGDTDLIFKTHWGGASYTATIATESAADWDAVSLEAIVAVDDEDVGGYSPVAIQPNVVQAAEVYINVEGTIYVDDEYVFATVASNIETDIQAYINNVIAGDNIVYSKIMYYVMQEPGVLKCTNLRIKRNDNNWITAADQSDISIIDTEVAVLDTGAYGPGTSFTEG